MSDESWREFTRENEKLNRETSRAEELTRNNLLPAIIPVQPAPPERPLYRKKLIQTEQLLLERLQADKMWHYIGIREVHFTFGRFSVMPALMSRSKVGAVFFWVVKQSCMSQPGVRRGVMWPEFLVRYRECAKRYHWWRFMVADWRWHKEEWWDEVVK